MLKAISITKLKRSEHRATIRKSLKITDNFVIKIKSYTIIRNQGV